MVPLLVRIILSFCPYVDFSCFICFVLFSISYFVFCVPYQCQYVGSITLMLFFWMVVFLESLKLSNGKKVILQWSPHFPILPLFHIVLSHAPIACLKLSDLAMGLAPYYVNESSLGNLVTQTAECIKKFIVLSLFRRCQGLGHHRTSILRKLMKWRALSGGNSGSITLKLCEYYK